MKYLLCLTFLCLIWILPACKKEVITPPSDLGYAYFPTGSGHWALYEVDSIYYQAGVRIEKRFQLKEVLQSEFSDLEGRTAVTCVRYRRQYDPVIPYDQLPWDAGYVVSATRTNQNVQLLEDNQTYMKLIFPPQNGKKWNGNTFNTQAAWTYSYSDVHQSSTLAPGFDSTVTVSQSGLNDPIINTQVGKEVYAKNVGLVYRSQTILNVQGIDTSGTSFTMTIKDFGN